MTSVCRSLSRRTDSNAARPVSFRFHLTGHSPTAITAACRPVGALSAAAISRTKTSSEAHPHRLLLEPIITIKFGERGSEPLQRAGRPVRQFEHECKRGHRRQQARGAASTGRSDRQSSTATDERHEHLLNGIRGARRIS
jgi:hypothetical protein